MHEQRDTAAPTAESSYIPSSYDISFFRVEIRKRTTEGLLEFTNEHLTNTVIFLLYECTRGTRCLGSANVRVSAPSL